MASLWVTEFASATADQGRAVPVPFFPAIATTVVTIGSETKMTFNTRTRFVRLRGDTLCYIKVGANPTATTGTDYPVGANQPEYIGADGSVAGGMKLSVIA